MSEPTLKLPAVAEELLREFPATEPDFEAQAQAIVARLKGSPGGVVFDDLLKVPELASEPGEVALQSSVRTAPAPKSNFAEMARKSVQKSDAAADQRELLAATAQSRRPNAEMVERVRAAGRPVASATPLPANEPRGERNSGVVTRAAAAVLPAVAVPAAQPTKVHPGTVIGIVGTAIAVAACVALFLKSGQPEPSTSAALAAERAAEAAPAAPAKVESAARGAAPSESVLSPEALAQAPAPAAVEARGGAVRAAPAVPAAAPVAKAGAASSAAAAQEAVVLEDDPEPPKVEAAERKAEPAPEPPMKPAEGNSGSVPLSPSAGAVSTALSSVRGGAQACLAGQSDPVTAVVTFGGDGHVLRVSASGPSGACIQAALAKAHIAPFAKDSFSATTTVRPP